MIAAWITLGTLAGIFIWSIVLFLMYRSDFAYHPERTRIAARRTLSTIKHALRLKRGEPPDDRRHGPGRRIQDLGTISGDIPAVPDPRHRPKRDRKEEP